jgi:hypothetical protein
MIVVNWRGDALRFVVCCYGVVGVLQIGALLRPDFLLLLNGWYVSVVIIGCQFTYDRSELFSQCDEDVRAAGAEDGRVENRWVMIDRLGGCGSGWRAGRPSTLPEIQPENVVPVHNWDKVIRVLLTHLPIFLRSGRGCYCQHLMTQLSRHISQFTVHVRPKLYRNLSNCDPPFGFIHLLTVSRKLLPTTTCFILHMVMEPDIHMTLSTLLGSFQLSI